MRHVFIINPNSGNEKSKSELTKKIKSIDVEHEIYVTSKQGDATNYIKEYCTNCKEDVTFYACGGDGTINEVASGIVEFNNARLACYPCGSGNDFVKMYGGKEKFLDIDKLINGTEIKIDIMKVNDRYAINVTNFGFDAKVCDVANKIRRKKIIGGKHSYTTGILVAIFKAMKNNCRIVADGEVLAEKNILLATIANGMYVGGAYKCAPYSNNQDGLLEISVIKPISIFKFAKLIGPYKKGTHLDIKNIDKILRYRKAKKVIVESKKEIMLCLDGEIYKDKYFVIENLNKGIRFVVPKD